MQAKSNSSRSLYGLIIATLFFYPFCDSFSAEPDTEFVSLFNGKDLSGWVVMGNPQAFTVQDGSIYSTGASPYPVWVRTQKKFENFILRFEYKTEGWYEGGLFLHAPLEGRASKIGMKMHIRHDRHWLGKRSPGAIYDAAEPDKLVNLPSGQWNQCEIHCNWPQLLITLNDEVIHDIDMNAHEELKYRMRRGYIGIQGIGCRGYFRNIRIHELPSKEKWNYLFEKGLDGFTFQEHTNWSIEDGILLGQGKLGHAITRQVFEEPFELQVWVKTILNGNGGVRCRWGEESQDFEVQVFNVPDSTNPTGSIYGHVPANRVVSEDNQWFLMQIFALGSQVVIRVDGETVAHSDELPPPFKGHIAFQQHTLNSRIWYKNARIKSVEFE